MRQRLATIGKLVMRALGIASPLGWAVLGAGVVALAVGATLGWAEFWAIAAVAFLVIILAIPFVLSSPKYTARVELASDRVVVGERAVGQLIVENTAKRTSPAARIELPVGRAKAEFVMPRLAPGGAHDELFGIPTQRRAVLTLGPVTSVRTDPLGLLRRVADWTEPEDLYVHPRVLPLESETAGIIRDLEGLPTRDLADDDISFHALREYAPGDDLRHVHWRSTARTGTLMIRQFEQTRRSHLVIVLSTRLADYASEDEFELAISIAGSVGRAALRTGKAVSILTSAAAIACATPNSMLDGLSAIEGLGEKSRGVADIAREVYSAAPNASVVAFITGANAATAELRAASVRVPSMVKSFGLRAAQEYELARRTVGDFIYLDVPSLGSLQRAMRSVSV